MHKRSAVASDTSAVATVAAVGVAADAVAADDVACVAVASAANTAGAGARPGHSDWALACSALREPPQCP